jgi:hypothetical protein
MKSPVIDCLSNVLTLPIRDVAAAYNQAGLEYVAYADGDPRSLFALCTATPTDAFGRS